MIWLIATASRTLACFSCALRMRRSAKTLPELGVTPDLFFVFGIARLIVRPGLTEPSGDQLDIRACCLYATGRLLLEYMQRVNCVFKLDRVNQAIGVSAMIFYKFKDARALASPRLRAGVLTAELRNAGRSSHFIDDDFREVQQLILGWFSPKLPPSRRGPLSPR